MRPVSFLLELYRFVLILYVIFSWVPHPPDALRPFILGVVRLVEPLAAPLRRSIPPLRLGMVALDLSIIVLFLGVWLLLNVALRAGL
jgi:YggT family protein